MAAWARSAGLLLLLITAGCTSTTSRPGEQAPTTLPMPRSIDVRATVDLRHGDPLNNSIAFEDRFKAAVRRRMPATNLTEANADLQLFLVAVDYVPAWVDRPHFPTFRYWWGEASICVTNRDGTCSYRSLFESEGTTYNPLYDPATRFADEVDRYLRAFGSTAELRPETAR